MGGAPLGGLYTDVSEDSADATIERCFSLGLNLFDTAPMYGAGKSETRLGRTLSKRPRDSFVIATKVGFDLAPFAPGCKEEILFPFDNAPPLRPVSDFSYDGALRSIDGSLKRLRLNRVDVLYVHEPTGFYEQSLQGALQALLKLRREGVVGAVGVAMNQSEMLARFAREGGCDCFLLAGRYTLIEQGALAELLPLCLKDKISIIIGGPYNSGILATGAKPGAKYNYLDAPMEILQRVQRIEAVCERFAVPLKAAALQFPLAHPAVASVVPGCASASEIEENFRMASHSVPSEFWMELRRRSLVPPEAPLPGENP